LLKKPCRQGVKKFLPLESGTRRPKLWGHTRRVASPGEARTNPEE
jgi:hypothetical protein